MRVGLSKKLKYFQLLLLKTPSHRGTNIFVLSCHQLLTDARICLYFQSHADSCLPEYELLFAQRGTRGCFQRTRSRVWRSGMPEIAQKDKLLITCLSPLIFTAKVANKGNVAKMTKTFTVGNFGQKIQETPKI